MNINLHIERLVIDAALLEARHGAAFQEALAAELTRLLREHGLAASLQEGGEWRQTQAAPLQVSRETTPQQLGAQTAQTVYAGLGSTGGASGSKEMETKR